MKASLSEEAVEDARAAADWYADQGAYEAVSAFFDDIERSIRLLERFPRMGARGVAQTRSLSLGSFPHSLVYRLAGDKIHIIAVAAHRRRPGYWSARR